MSRRRPRPTFAEIEKSHVAKQKLFFLQYLQEILKKKLFLALEKNSAANKTLTRAKYTKNIFIFLRKSKAALLAYENVGRLLFQSFPSSFPFFFFASPLR